MHTYINKYMHTCIHTCMYISMCMCMCIINRLLRSLQVTQEQVKPVIYHDTDGTPIYRTTCSSVKSHLPNSDVCDTHMHSPDLCTLQGRAFGTWIIITRTMLCISIYIYIYIHIYTYIYIYSLVVV